MHTGRLWRWLALAVALVATTAAFQCNTSTPYGKAVKVGLDITDTVHTGADTVDKLRLNGTLTVEEERTVLGYFATVNRLDVEVYGPCIQAAHLAGDKPQGFLGCAQSLANSLQDPSLLASVHVSNPDSQRKVQQISQAVVNLAQTGVTLFTTLSQKGQ